MTLVAKPPKLAPKSKYRIEIDDIGSFKPTTVGPLKTTFNLIETEEGGAQTTASITVNGYKYEPIPIERPLTDADDSVMLWAENFKKGIQDIRNGAVYAMDPEGRDLFRWDLEEISMVDFEDFQGDAKAVTESMMEKFTIKYREKGKRQKLQ